MWENESESQVTLIFSTSFNPQTSLYKYTPEHILSQSIISLAIESTAKSLILNLNLFTMVDTVTAEMYKELKENLTKLEAELEKKNNLVAELKSKIECPVCLAIPTEGPMASCPNGHLLCIPCHQVMLAGALVNCPNCREPMGNNMNWLARR